MGKVYRPWGYYIFIASGEKFRIKKLFVNPGQSLSLQLFNHRTETWTILSGKARVTQGDRIRCYTRGEYLQIWKGEKHRLENLEDIPLEVLEVQFGDYLGEDDIVRFEDKYGRV